MSFTEAAFIIVNPELGSVTDRITCRYNGPVQYRPLWDRDEDLYVGRVVAWDDEVPDWDGNNLLKRKVIRTGTLQALLGETCVVYGARGRAVVETKLLRRWKPGDPVG